MGKNNGNGGGNGGGDNGGGGGGNNQNRNRNRDRDRNRDRGRNDPLADVPEDIADAVRAAGQLAYGSQLADVRGEIKGTKSHRRTVDRAYDAYAQQLQRLTAAQQAASQQAQASVLGAANSLQGIGANVTQQGVEQAQQQAALLGQGTTVADTTAALGGSAGVSRAAQAMAGQEAMARVGLANFSDLTRRGATGERDRIRAMDDVQDRLVELRGEKRDIKHEKGAFMANALFEAIQQQKENAIALAGLRLDRRSQRADEEQDQNEYELALQQLALDVEDTRHDNALDDREQRHDEHEDREDDRGGGRGDNDLTASEQDTYQRYVNQVQAARQRIADLVQRGMSLAEARRRTQTQQSVDEWIVRVAAGLVGDGSLSGSLRALAKSKLPGGQLPGPWR